MAGFSRTSYFESLKICLKSEHLKEKSNKLALYVMLWFSTSTIHSLTPIT